MEKQKRDLGTDRFGAPGSGWSEADIRRLEEQNAHGLTVQQIVDAFVARGERLTEATFRKYVQLGLLPRSVRVGRKGKHRGSQGFYPTAVVRQIEMIRRLMSQGFTIEEIQQEFFFIRSDIAALNEHLEKIYVRLDEALTRNGSAQTGSLARQSVAEIKKIGSDLIGKLEEIEHRLSMKARMNKAAV
jgi:DNA-binding transcriptional MerR regulator